jgi:hypothetical protein
MSATIVNEAMMCTIQSPSPFEPKCVWHVLGVTVCRYFGWPARPRQYGMTNKITTPHDTKKQAKVTHPGMLGEDTEEQNLGQRGNQAARIKKKEVTAAFGKQRPKK